MLRQRGISDLRRIYQVDAGLDSVVKYALALPLETK